MTSIIEELAAKTRAGGSGALPSASPRQGERKSSIILELAAKSGMNTNADINTLKNAAMLPTTGADTAAETEQKQNTGGFFGGVGYLANKVGVGFVSSLEGISDYVLGGMAKLFGADDWAEEVMGTDWFDYSHPENWYNPSRGWQVAGDVFGGIGTSLPAIGTVAAAAALVGGSGGTLAPLAQGLISAGVAGLAAAGRSTSEAYKRTGTLGGKEWAYGTLSGTTEGVVEGLSTALGLGAARLGTKLVGNAGGNAAKELVKTATFGGVLKEMGKSFIGEASEEAISEIVDPWWQRMTIDEYAPSATAKEVGYAALVGGLSGVLMDGVATSFQHTNSVLRGNRINGKGNTASVLDTARSISDFEGKNKTGIQDFAYISEAYNKLTDSIKSTDGKVTTMAQKKLLGDLAAANNSYNIKRFVATDAYNIVSNAEAIAENLEKFGYRTVDGKEMRYSAAELTEGYDAKKPKSIYKALETNEALRSLAVTAATGRLLIDTARTEQATLAGEALMSKADLARFLETASAEEIRGVEEAFGIEDLRTADADALRNRIIAFAENGGIEAEMQKRQNATELAAIPAPEVGVIPTTDIYMDDGEAHRYSNGDLNIAISRKGDAYLIYDYSTKKLSRELSEYEMNEYLSEYRRGKDAYIAEQRAYTERQAEKAKRAELSREVRGKADATLRENIKGYATSPATLQAQLRKVYHDAVVSGISEADALSYARVSERTGLDMIFSRELCATADGSYADGYYDPIKNRIVINPETKRAHGALLMHELTHAIYYKDGMLTIAEGIEKMPAEKKQAIMKKYTKAGITDSVTLADEMNAHYAEETLKNFGTLEKLCADKPTLKEKILSFFRGAETDYRGDAKLTKAAKQLYAQYKKLFDSFAAKGRGSNAMDLMPVRTNADTEGDDGRRYSIQDGAFSARNTEYAESYAKRIDAWDKTTKGFSFILGESPEYLSDLESGGKKIGKQQVRIDATKIKKIMSDHAEMTIDVVKKLPELLNTPILVMDSNTVKGRLVLVGEVYANGKPVMMALELNPRTKSGKSTYLDVIKVASAYTRSNLQSMISNSRIRYVSENKSRVDNWLKVNRLQLPLPNAQFDSAINSIHENSEKVNTLKEKSDGKRYALPEGESAFDEETADAKIPEASSDMVKPIKKSKSRTEIFNRASALKIGGDITKVGILSRNARVEVTQALHDALRSAKNADERQEIIDCAASAVLQSLVNDGEAVDAKSVYAAERATTQLHRGVRKLALTESDMAELKEIVDKKKFNSIRGRWLLTKAGNNWRIPLDVFVSDVSEHVDGMKAMLEGMTPAQALVKINEEYLSAKEKAGEATKLMFKKANDRQLTYLVNQISNDILYTYNAAINKMQGEDTFIEDLEIRLNSFAEQQDYYKEQLGLYKKDEALRAYIAEQALRMTERRFYKYKNMTQPRLNQFKEAMKELNNIKWRGKFNATSARKYIGELYQWYTSSDVRDGFLGYQSDAEPNLYNAEIAGFMERIASSGNGETFTHGELSNLYKVYGYFNNLFDNYGKYWRNGQWIETQPEAKRFIEISKRAESSDFNPFRWAVMNVYGRYFFKPDAVARAIDGYRDGFATRMVLDIREASEQAAIKRMKIMFEYDEFVKKNKKYQKTLRNERVSYGVERGSKKEITMPKSTAMALLMTLKRKHSRMGIVFNGYEFVDTDGRTIEAAAMIDGSEAEMSVLGKRQQADAVAENVIKELESKFSATDKQYIEILERGFEAAGRLKAERDMIRQGYTNAMEDYYFPLIRANAAKSIDSIQAEFDRISNASFNKDTVTGSAQSLFIGDADAIFRRHIQAVCLYNTLSPVIDEYNMLWNIDVEGNPNAPTSIATTMKNSVINVNNYIKDLIADVQGVPRKQSLIGKAVNFIRSGYAKFQLGANPKTCAKQLTSLAASTSILDWDSLIKGAFIPAKDVDTYCPLAALRNYEDTAANAQAVLDTAGKKAKNSYDKFTDALMIPIGKTDRFVVERLFGGCQVQVAKESGGKLAIGTEANKVAAGKMLAQVIRDTQQNALAIEKSAAMRDGHEIARAATMFTADSVAIMSKTLSALGEYTALKAELKAATNAETKAKLAAQLKAAGKAARKSTIALISTSLFGVGVDVLFAFLFNKMKDEPEEEIKDATLGFFMNMIGGLPIIKDIVSNAFEGYDIKNYTYSAANDMISSLANLTTTTKDWLSGEDNEQARNKALKNFAYSMGQVFGMPVRNVYNLVYGLTKRIVPSTAYEWDTHFYTKTYGSDFSAALEKDDTDTASFILSLMTKNEVGGELDEKVRSEFVALAKSGNKVLPKSVPDSITVDGTAYKFTRSEKEAIREEYASVNATVKKLVSNVRYRVMDENTRAYALKYVYSAHLEKAYSEVLYGGARDAEMIAADIIGIDMMAIAKAIKKSVTGDTDGDGKAISGSKRQNIIARIRALPMTSEEKLLLIAMLGYKIQAGDIGGMDESRAKKKLLSYIFAQKLTADEKAALCTKCGFEVQNGRVSTKNL